MRQRFLQIASLINIFLLVSCSVTNKKSTESIEVDDVYGGKDYADAFVSSIKPRWFETANRFKLVDANKQILPHRFFDANPAIDLNKKTVNAIVTTPKDSLYGYDLDIASGQLYLAKKFCEQPDRYQQYPGKVFRPPFSIGVVPRILDQLNMPQKIIVFGGSDYFTRYHRTHLFDIRLVGAYIEQNCPHGTCVEASQWESRLVLVGVQNGNNAYKDVHDLVALKKIEKWDYVKAFIENGYGCNKVADKYYPGFRMGAEVTATQALAFLERNSTIFTIQRLASMRKSCYKMYDFLWKDLSAVSSTELVANTTDEIRQKASKINQAEQKGIQPFYRRFVKNFKQYHEQYKTCSKYILPSNINDSPERHWFFAFYSAFHRMHELGQVFDCNAKRWELNPFIGKNRRAVALKDQLGNCSGKDIDIAFEQAVVELGHLRTKGRKSFRYVDYDSGINGTHAKIYNWVPHDYKSMSCSENEDSEFSLKAKTFPEDIKWTPRGSAGKTKTEIGDIIY
jgi:hypothetical protein